MVFYSNNFIFNKISSEDLDIHLVSEDTDILCEYGIPFNIEDDENEITLRLTANCTYLIEVK